MQITIETFEQAVSAHLSPVIARRLLVASRAVASRCGAEPSDTLTLQEAGEVLAVALAGDESFSLAHAVNQMQLVGGKLSSGGDVADMDQAEVSAHPLVGRWVSPTLACAVTDFMRTAAHLTQLDPASPNFVSIEMVEVEGALVTASARLIFPNVRFGIPAMLDLYFGRPALAYSAPCCNRRLAQGQALMDVGAALALDPTDQAPTEPQTTQRNDASHFAAETWH